MDYSSLCFPLAQKGVGDEGWGEGRPSYKTVLVNVPSCCWCLSLLYSALLD